MRRLPEAGWMSNDRQIKGGTVHQNRERRREGGGSVTIAVSPMDAGEG